MLGSSKVMLISSKEIESKKDGKKYQVLSFLPEKGNSVIEVFTTKEALGNVDLVERDNYILEYNLNEKRSEQNSKLAFNLISLTAE